MIITEPKVLVPKSELKQDKVAQLERYARTCYKSEDKLIGDGKLIRSCIERGHESIIEHEKATVLFIVDRGVSHEIVRHRIAAYSQESTRYCNYGHDGEITVINPFFFMNTANYSTWFYLCEQAERAYMELLRCGALPQEARSVLPNSLKTEIVVTFNMREWRHFFKLRCAPAAHPQMRQVAIPLLCLFAETWPAIFRDIAFDTAFPVEHYAEVKLTDNTFREL